MNIELDMFIEECCACHMPFGVSKDFVERRRNDHKTFYCPMGHGQSFSGKSEEQRLRDQLVEKNLQIGRLETDLRNALKPKPRGRPRKT